MVDIVLYMFQCHNQRWSLAGLLLRCPSAEALTIADLGFRAVDGDDHATWLSSE